MPFGRRGKRQIWLRQLLDELPVELPLPAHAQVIISCKSWEGGQTFFTILMQVPQPVSRLQVSYANRLRALGWLQWYPDDHSSHLNLFVRNHHFRTTSPVLVFYDLSKSISLTLHTCSVEENTTYIILELSTNDRFFPYLPGWMRSEPLNLAPLPQLIPPPAQVFQADASSSFAEVKYQGGTAGGSGYISWYSNREIQTSLDSLDVLTHYHSQLSQAGWIQQAEAIHDQLLWSVWILSDRHNQLWQLLLSLVVDQHHSNHYSASLKILNLSAHEPVLPPASIPEIPAAESIPEEVMWEFWANDPYQQLLVDAPITTKQLWIGQLPPTLPVPLTLSAQTQVLGSMTINDNQINLFLREPRSLVQASDYFDEQFHTRSWLTLSHWNDFEGIGFVTSKPNHLAQNIFTHPQDGTECIVALDAVAADWTDITISWRLFAFEVNEFSLASTRSHLQAELRECPVPALAKPDQTTITPSSGGISDMMVQITTSHSASGLASHYQTEMQRAGWQQQVASLNENCHVSLWSFVDEQERSWQAALRLLANPERDGQFTGYLTIKQLSEPENPFQALPLPMR
jgi:hypothetical protein